MNDNLNLLRLIYEEFVLEPVEAIDIFCVLKREEGYMPRKIKKLLTDEASNKGWTDKEAKSRIKSLKEDTNKFGVLNRKYQRSGVVSLFKNYDSFLKAFLKRFPSPQDVHLPFYAWDDEILSLYIKIVYEKKIALSTIQKALSSYHVPSHLHFLTSSANLNSNNCHIFLWFIRFLKLEGTKFSHILPLRFECKNDFSTNYKTLNLYPYDKFTSENNIYKFLERCVPKNINLKNTIFLIVESETKVEYFKKVFLTTEYIPKAHFVFFKPLKDMKKLASLSGCYELDVFLGLYKPIYKKIRKYLSDIIPNTTNPATVIRDIKKYMTKI